MKERIRKEKGITLTTLVITIIILLILTSTTIYNAQGSIRIQRLTKLVNDLELLREKVKILFNNLVENIDEFYKQMLSEYVAVPIFEKYDMDVLYTKLENIPNNDLYNLISNLL